MNNNQKIARNTLFMSVRMIIVLSLSLYSSRIILANLGVEDYGIYNVVAGFITMFTFLNSSLANGIQRFYNYELAKTGDLGANQVFNAAIIIQVFLAFWVLLPAEMIGSWYIKNVMVIPIERIQSAKWVFQLSLVTFLFNILQVPFQSAVIAHEKMDFMAIISVLNAVLTLVAAFLLPYIDADKLLIYGLLMMFIAILIFAFYVLYCLHSFKEVYLNLTFSPDLFKNMLTFSGWNLFGSLGNMVKDQGTNLILNYFFGPIVNAARGLANQVNNGIQSLISNVTVPVRPQVIQSFSQGNVLRSLNLTMTISKISSYLLLCVSLPVILEIKTILAIWLGNNIPEYTSIFIIVILINSLILNLNTAISGVVHASGDMKTYQLSGGVISLISVIAACVSIMLFDTPLAAVVTVLIADILRQLVSIYILSKIVDEFTIQNYMKLVIFPFIRVMIVAILAPCIIRFSMDQTTIRFIIVFLVSILSVAVSVWYIGLNVRELELIKSYISIVRNKFSRLKDK